MVGGQTHALLYSAGSLVDLGSLGGGYSYAFGLNDSGQVVGESSLGGGVVHAFSYSGGSMSDVGTLYGPGVNSTATAINNASQIAGYSQTSGGSPNFAFLKSGGSLTSIVPFAGYSNAYGMNEIPQVVGHSDGQGFLWSGGTKTTIPNAVTASGINESGQVTGFTFGGFGNFNSHAYLYSGGVTTDLGTLGGAFSNGAAINDLGQVVGHSERSSGLAHGFIYSGGVMQDLTALVEPGFEIYAAYGINNAGQIAAYGIQTATGQPQGLLLTPNRAPTADAGGPYSVPEGGSVTLTGSGIDADGDPLTFAWDLDNNGTFESSGQSVVFSAAGRDGSSVQTIGLRVTDTLGDFATTAANVNIINVAPTLTLTGAGFTYEGDAYSLNLASSGPGPDTITAWTINWGDGSPPQVVTGNPPSVSHVYVDGPNAFTISAAATDEDGTFGADSVSVSVGVIMVASISGASSVAEGSAYTLNLAANDPGTDTIMWWLIDWLDGSPGQFVPGNPSSVTHVFADGPLNQPIQAWFENEDGVTDGATLFVMIDNVAPTATNNTYATAQAIPVSGNVIADNTGSGADSDPAGANDPLTVSSHSDPINGALVLNANGSFTYTPESTFSGSDSFTYTISDGDGGFATATVTFSVAPPAPGSILTVADTCLGGSALLIAGTAADDEIVVEPGSTAQTLTVTINGVTSTATRPSGRIIVIGASGDDDIQIAGSVTNAAWLYGDAGDDRLKGGAGDDVLLGGADDDLLVGGSGRDMLIGGTEADRIVGNADDDVLIAGSTSFDALEAALCAIMDEWTSQRTNAQRRLYLLGSTTGGANGAYYLQADVTVFNDVAADVLTGSAGQDWFFANLDSGVKDKITDLSASEFAVDLDFILGP